MVPDDDCRVSRGDLVLLWALLEWERIVEWLVFVAFLLLLPLIAHAQTPAPALPAPVTLWTTQVPTVPDYTGPMPYELGVRFVSDVPGMITALRFWKPARDTSTSHIGRLWSGAGWPIASVTFVNETASGWQQQALTAPVQILAHTEYVVSVPTGPTKVFALTAGTFLEPVIRGPLVAPASAGRYGPAGAFPATLTPNAYFRDVVFVPAAPAAITCTVQNRMVVWNTMYTYLACEGPPEVPGSLPLRRRVAIILSAEDNSGFDGLLRSLLGPLGTLTAPSLTVTVTVAPTP